VRDFRRRTLFSAARSSCYFSRLFATATPRVAQQRALLAARAFERAHVLFQRAPRHKALQTMIACADAGVCVAHCPSRDTRTGVV